jgi:hypothetical protein
MPWLVDIIEKAGPSFVSRSGFAGEGIYATVEIGIRRT